MDVLDIGSEEPGYNGRFIYITTPLPTELTRGKKSLHCEIRATGGVWGYGTKFEQYQQPMREPSRGLYRVYCHTDGYFVPPADEKQGEAPATLPVRKEPGPEVLEQLKARVNRDVAGTLKATRPLNQVQIEFLARAYHVGWTPAHQNKRAVEQVTKGLDAVFAAYRKDPKLAQADPVTYNPDWFGLGPAGDAIRLLADALKGGLDEDIPDGAGGTVKRRTGWAEMLVASRDWHRRHRRLYTNQSMINDLYGIYLCNRGVAVVDSAQALPEAEVRRYLYESVGLQPWLGSDTDKGPAKPVGDHYLQLTARGLTRELGYVGNYGEVLDWVNGIYDATRPALGQPGDERIKAQLVKMARARSYFREPKPDADGCRAMRLETVVGWRDVHFPGDVTYGQRTSRDASALQTAANTLDAASIGYAQQMLADNQFFAETAHQMKEGGLRVTAGLLQTPDQYELLKAQPPSRERLPMTPGAPDFVFADEEDGVVAVKHGDDILYVSLYWRARYAVNGLARVHYITPRLERVAVVRAETQFEPSGLTYTRPDWTNMGFANGGLRYPGEYHSAIAGEKLPIARIPDGVAFKPGQENVYAGKGTFYSLRYGPYLIGMNCTADKTFELKLPDGTAGATDLATGRPVTGGRVAVGPISTVVLWLGR